MQSFSDLSGLNGGLDSGFDGGLEGIDGREDPAGPAGSGQGRRPSGAGDSLPVVAGVAMAIAAVGAVLALADIGFPLRAPFTLFFLLVAPACAVAAALRGLDPLSRSVVATGGAVVVDLLTAQTMLALHLWSVRGGVAAVGAVSLLLFLLAHAHRQLRRGRRGTCRSGT
ncbi:hypothetical protein [Streptomyces orinoci]|uniref:Integral membrane protein n=1 Tax=Streptomyces orinoci TaxID=67339 RepID=A0ABV3K4M9_STRON|nr:hypothetical protein [Streptomyces orinoci]